MPPRCRTDSQRSWTSHPNAATAHREFLTSEDFDALLLVAIQTGLRVSELTGLTVSDVHLGPGAHVRCHSKGRKVRATPLTQQATAVLRAWLFPARAGRLSRDAVERLVAKHAAVAATCPSLSSKNVTPHTLRHSAASA
jgi:integrase/recombinase XerD